MQPHNVIVCLFGAAPISHSLFGFELRFKAHFLIDL